MLQQEPRLLSTNKRHKIIKRCNGEQLSRLQPKFPLHTVLSIRNCF